VSDSPRVLGRKAGARYGDSVIVRIWEAEVAPERVDEFCLLIASTILPKVLAVDGCLGGEVLRPVADDLEAPCKVVGITRWRDEQCLRAFLGPMWRLRPMWEEQELEYVAGVPRVFHFEPVEAS
jgi:quinol monooxygenase YgiN